MQPSASSGLCPSLLTSIESHDYVFQVPHLLHESALVSIPILSSSLKTSMAFIVEHGIGSILVFEYFYFLLQVNQENQAGVKKCMSLAVKEYQMSGVQATVIDLIASALQTHGENVEILCPILVDIATANQMSKKLLK